MLDNLTNRFSKVLKNIRGQSTLTEDNIKEALREVRLALLEADVALPVVKEFSSCPPVSVCGTVRFKLKLSGFSWKRGIGYFMSVDTRRHFSVLRRPGFA